MSTTIPDWQPDAGPELPLHDTPHRHSRSMRRTTSIDIPWPDFDQGLATIVLAGRDLFTTDQGEPETRDHVEVTIRTDLAAGKIIDAGGEDDSFPWDVVIGATLRSGFGRHLSDVLPAAATERPLRFSILDDLPGAFLVSGYSMVRNGLLRDDPTTGPERARHQADVCIGWATGSPVHTVLHERGQTAIPFGPDAPTLNDQDPSSWHELPRIDVRTVRRARQIDVWNGDRDTLMIQSHFRDSYVSDEHEMVMHEYLVRATIDAGRRIERLEIEPRVLPWAACPGATASAQTLVGCPLEEIHERARVELAGPQGCTHLSSTLRALADVRSLAEPLDG